VTATEEPIKKSVPVCDVAVSLLTGGGDRPYALGLARCLSTLGTHIDFIGSDDLDLPELRAVPHLRFLNLRGSQREEVSFWKKALRIVRYYLRLGAYAATAKPKLFHILWNNRFELVDRTGLMVYYRLCGRRVVLTAHNINARKRDGSDSYLNRLSLKIQYGLCDHMFVHTAKMKQELKDDFGVPEAKVSVIPLGLNETVPTSDLTVTDAKRRVGIKQGEKAILFFGRIAPYKGLEYLIEALRQLRGENGDYRLVIAGSIKGCDEYWETVERRISDSGLDSQVLKTIRFIPDEETEIYFKAADVLVLPYREIFQSGVLVLSYSFGLPVIAADVGSMVEDVVDGVTGFIFEKKNTKALADALLAYFSSDLYRNLENNREKVQAIARERFSWETVGEITKSVYLRTLTSR